jgi:hypothetical protein
MCRFVSRQEFAAMSRNTPAGDLEASHADQDAIAGHEAGDPYDDESSRPASEPPRQGLLDTNILVLRRRVDPAVLPDEMAISAITLAELSAGPHQVRPNSEQDLYDEHEERPAALRPCSGSTPSRSMPKRPGYTGG